METQETIKEVNAWLEEARNSLRQTPHPSYIVILSCPSSSARRGAFVLCGIRLLNWDEKERIALTIPKNGDIRKSLWDSLNAVLRNL